jgi:hypothetical protein
VRRHGAYSSLNAPSRWDLIKNCYHLRRIENRRYNIDRAYGTLNFNRTGRDKSAATLGFKIQMCNQYS